MPTSITRRAALAGAVVVPIVALPAVAAAEPFMPAGESLADLCQRYRQEVAAVNAMPDTPDEAMDAICDETYHATMKRMATTPIRTSDDARAALQWLCDEGADLGSEYANTGYDLGREFGEHNRFTRLVTHLVDELRRYLAGLPNTMGEVVS